MRNQKTLKDRHKRLITSENKLKKSRDNIKNNKSSEGNSLR